MRVLTVRQPWAYAITHLGKSPENRSTLWSYRGPVAIHAAAAFDLGALDHPEIRTRLSHVAATGFGVPMAWDVPMHTSAVLGVGQLIGAHPCEDGCCPGNGWADRAARVHVVIRDVVPIDPIHNVKGRLGLWHPDPGLLTEIGRRLAAVPPEVINAVRATRTLPVGGPK